MNNKITISLILGLVILIGIIFFLLRKSHLSDEIYDQNISALTDSVRTEKLKNGKILSLKNLLITKLEDVGKYNKDLANTLDSLKKKGTQILYINKTEVRYIKDTQYLASNYEDLGNGKFKINWGSDISNPSFELNGSSSFRVLHTQLTDSTYRIELDSNSISSVMNKLKINISLTSGIRSTRDGRREVFVTSNTPGVEIVDINSVIISDAPPINPTSVKKRSVALGFSTGYGVMMNLNNQQLYHGPYVGFGININLINLFKK